VDRDTTLSAGTYLLNRPLVVRGAALTLEAGVHLVFQGTYGVVVEEGGSLQALGDSLRPVVLEGEGWQGVRLTAHEAGSRLVFCRIQGAALPAALQVYSAGRSEVVHCQIGQNAGFGVFLARGAWLQRFQGNDLTGNQWYPVLCQDLGGLQGMDSTNSLANGERSGVWVDGDVEVRTPHHLHLGTWNPLHIAGDLRVADTLSLEDMVLRLLGGITVSTGGVFRARAVQLEPLQETWQGVAVEGGSLVWHQVVLQRAGTPARAALWVGHGSGRVLWSEGAVVAPPGSGLDLAEPPESLWNVRVAQAGAVPVILRNAHLLAAPLNLHLQENPSPWIKVTSAQVQTPDTWRPPGAPVVFTGNVVLRPSGGEPVELVLLPGLELRFYEYAGVLVGQQGPARLVARGVRFTGRDPVDPRWRSLRFGPETLEGTRLDSCVLEYGGQVYTQADSGIVVISDTRVPVLQNNLIQYSHTYGVYLRGSANDAAYRQDLLNQNTFLGNTLGDVGP